MDQKVTISNIRAIVESYEEKKSQVPTQYQCSDDQYKELTEALKNPESTDFSIWMASAGFIKQSKNTVLAKLLGEYWISQSTENSNNPAYKIFKQASEYNVPENVICLLKPKESLNAATYSSVFSSSGVGTSNNDVEQKNSVEKQKDFGELLKEQEADKQKLLESHKEQSTKLQETKEDCQKKLLALEEQVAESRKQLSVLEEQAANYQRQLSATQEQEKKLAHEHKKQIEELDEKQEKELAPFLDSGLPATNSEQKAPTLG